METWTRVPVGDVAWGPREQDSHALTLLTSVLGPLCTPHSPPQSCTVRGPLTLPCCWCYYCSLTKLRVTLETLWTAAQQTSLSFAVSWSSLKLMSIESVMPSNHLILCSSLLLLLSIFPSIRAFSGESALCIRRPKHWSFSFSISPSNEYSELNSFRIDWYCCPRDSQESSPTPQFQSTNSLVFSLLYGPTLTSVHDYWKNHSFD